MRLELALALVALALPAITDALLFGVTLTTAAGATILAANPVQTAGIIGLGALGAALGAAGIAALQPKPSSTTVIVKRPGRYRYRGRRQAVFGGTTEELTEAFNEIFSEIEKKVMDGCFQRLICDISARPDSESIQLISAVEIATVFNLKPKALAVAKKISAARKIGQTTRDVRACETAYNRCPWTGQRMQQAIQEFQTKYQ